MLFILYVLYAFSHASTYKYSTSLLSHTHGNTGASAFTKSTKAHISTSSLSAKSKSVPFLEQPAKLDGTMAGDVGFDPAGFLNMKRFKYTKGTDGKMFAGWTEDIDW